MGYDVFLSYSRNDQHFADALLHHLEQKGVGCWIDHRDLSPGAVWAEEIDEAIRENPGLVMVLIFSSNTNSSTQVQKELNLADSHKIPIIPVRIENVQPSGAYAYHLGSINWMDVFGEDQQKQIDQIAERVKGTVLKLKSRKGVLASREGKEIPTNVNEQKYINELRKALEDGQIIDAEMNKLKIIAETLDISPEHAKELEEKIKREMGLSLSENEQKYVNELRKALEDGQITDNEENRLKIIADTLEISPGRVNELQEQVKKELGSAGQQEQQSSEEIDWDERYKNRDMANTFIEELSSKYAKLLETLDTEIRLYQPRSDTYVTFYLDISIGEFNCIFEAGFYKDNIGMWAQASNQEKRDFWQKWLDENCKGVLNYEPYLDELPYFVQFWDIKFDNKTSREEKELKFKEATIKTLDVLLPKLVTNIKGLAIPETAAAPTVDNGREFVDSLKWELIERHNENLNKIGTTLRRSDTTIYFEVEIKGQGWLTFEASFDAENKNIGMWARANSEESRGLVKEWLAKNFKGLINYEEKDWDDDPTAFAEFWYDENIATIDEAKRLFREKLIGTLDILMPRLAEVIKT